MKIHNISIILSILLIFLTPDMVTAQDGFGVTGKVMSALDQKPIEGAMVWAKFEQNSSITDANGNFKITLANKNEILVISARGYDDYEMAVNSSDNQDVFLLPQTSYMYNGKIVFPRGEATYNTKAGSSKQVKGNDLPQAGKSIDESLSGLIPGLYVKGMSGMPGEGSFLSVNGTRSFIGSNMPMIIIDGMVYIPNHSESPVINGFSRNAFMPFDLGEVENITLINGADAGQFGSIGSAGIINIQSERAYELNTKVEYQTINGLSWFNKRIPLMQGTAFKNYIGDVAATRYSDLDALVNRFPYLKDDPDYHYNYLYDNEVNWQDEVYTQAYSTKHAFKIRGGDAIAKYALSVGYSSDKGIIENTSLDKYYTKLNADINITKRLSMFASAFFSADEGVLQEQGMAYQTNPLLTAYAQGPLFGKYEKNTLGIDLPVFANLANNYTYLGISNPLAVVSDVDITSKAHDVLVSTGLNYEFNKKWVLHAIGGFVFNSNREKVFIPGKDSEAIAPLMNGLAQNTVRNGNGVGFSLYSKMNVNYHSIVRQNHLLNVDAGLQVLTQDNEYDAGFGINTSSDFYRTLNSTHETEGRLISGYINKWNWLNMYATGQYSFKNMWYVNMGLAVDGASSVGQNSNKLQIYPTITTMFNLNRIQGLGISSVLDDLSVRAGYSMTGNSRFSSHFGQYTYQTQNYRDLTGIVRVGIPNSKLEPEINTRYSLGLHVASIRNLVEFNVEWYNIQTRNMVLQNEMPAAYGFGYTYKNGGELSTSGVDLSLNARLINTTNFSWMIGGNISSISSEIKKIGDIEESIIKYSDGSMLINRVGESPYSYYGYKMEKVIYSNEEAKLLNLQAHNGETFEAGDVKFVDNTGDGTINEKDLVILGNATPDFYGGLYTSTRYKSFSLTARFSYAYGGELYNAVRRSTGSLSSISNQSTEVERRWSYDGQVTDIPKAEYGDPMGNARFSSRWIEDGSFIRLKSITIAYELPESFRFIQGGKVFVTGENLWTQSAYLGLDPEFSYSYSNSLQGYDLGKAPQPKSIKLGIKLQF